MTRFRRIVVLGVVGAAVTSPALAHDGGRLPRGRYTVRLIARSGDDQVSAVVAARRL